MVEVRYAGFNEPYFGEDHVKFSSVISMLTLPARGNMFLHINESGTADIFVS